MKDFNINKKELINHEKSALVLVDLQNGIVNRNLSPYSGKEVVENARNLIKAFGEKNSFVVLVRISMIDDKDYLKPKTDLEQSLGELPENWDTLVDQIKKFDNTYTITKRQWGAFHGTDLDLQLRRRGIDTIILGGISTNIGVDTTAREAYQNGYNQLFVEDAMSAVTKEEHDYVCKYIFPRIGKIRTTEEIISML